LETFKELLGIQSNLEAAYWVIAITATLLFISKFLLSIIGSDSGEGEIDGIDVSGGDADISADMDISEGSDSAEADTGYFSIDTVLSFLKGAGWIGVICYRFTRFSPGSIIAITLVSGVVTFFFAWFLLKNLKKFESSGNMEIKNAIGNTGSVYMNIPSSGNGRGQVQVELQGRLATLEAMSMNRELKTGEKILVCAIDKKTNTIMVAPYKTEDSL